MRSVVTLVVGLALFSLKRKVVIPLSSFAFRNFSRDDIEFAELFGYVAYRNLCGVVIWTAIVSLVADGNDQMEHCPSLGSRD